jgi:hypothetical protein
MFKLLCAGLVAGGVALAFIAIRNAVFDYVDDIDWDG